MSATMARAAGGHDQGLLSLRGSVHKLRAVTRRPREVEVSAPAKVNLVLRIVGRRDDGYHLLESLMVPVSWCDRVVLRVHGSRGRAPRIACRVNGREKVPGGKRNLAARAAALVLAALGEKASVDLRLYKNIPAGAGLGGGSSDAAAVLRALPSLLGRRLPRSRLVTLASELGADVPFFLDCVPAWASGIGERLTPLPRFPSLNLVIAVPRRRVETAWAYRHALPGPRVLASRLRTRPVRRVLHPSAKSLSSLVFNDFEQGVEAAVPDVDRLKKALTARGALGVVLSGSGSAVVGIFESRAAARGAAGQLGPPDTVVAVRTVRRRPSVEE